MRIWGPPGDPDNESSAPLSSDDGKSMKSKSSTEPDQSASVSYSQSSHSERSNSLPVREGSKPTTRVKSKRKTSLGVGPSAVEKGEGFVTASNAEKVMQEIGKAINELRISEAFDSAIDVNNDVSLEKDISEGNHEEHEQNVEGEGKFGKENNH